MLSHSYEDRLVIRRRVNRRHSISASWETTGNRSSEDAALGLVVETLEERELGRVGGLRAVKRRNRLDDDVGVARDFALCVNLLWRGEVVLVRVHKVACRKVLDGHRNREVLVRRDVIAVLRAHELGGGHVRRRSDDAHRRGIARAGSDLLPVRDIEVRHCCTEVDEVVRRGQRRNLASRGSAKNTFA